MRNCITLEHCKRDPETGAWLLPLGGRQHPGRYATVDECDLERVVSYAGWSPILTNPRALTLYARAQTKIKPRRQIYLHRFILDLDDPRVKVDHENHNGLDCRRVNLRIATSVDNARNRSAVRGASSRYKGVHWHCQMRKWVAYIKPGGRSCYLGSFDDEESAARVYDQAARAAFGSFAFLNFPDEMS